MIEIVSLLLGLVTGAQVVEVAVSGPVAEVELLLDGESVGVLDSEPWRFWCDFGSELVPRELSAVARDAEGRELDRAEHWINVQRQPVAGAALVFSGAERGTPEAVGVVWESLGQREPHAVQIELDGVPLDAPDPTHVPLPPYDPQEMHYLSATLHFHDQRVAYLDAGFGATWDGEITTGLTTVAVSLEKGARMPPVEKLAGWFLKGGEPIPVQAVEKGEAEVVVVRDPALVPALEELVTMVESWDLGRVGRLTAYGPLGDDAYLRLMSPAAAPLSPDQVSDEMFARSMRYDAGEAGLLWLSQQVRPRNFAMLFSHAVALAGTQAHASARRRAVVLLLGGSPSEWDTISPESARRYLRLLGVPLFVWSLAGERHVGFEDARPVPLLPDLRAGHKRLKRAIEDLRASLESQRVVWLEGRHLPQEIELAPEAVGLRLAGRE